MSGYRLRGLGIKPANPIGNRVRFQQVVGMESFVVVDNRAKDGVLDFTDNWSMRAQGLDHPNSRIDS